MKNKEILENAKKLAADAGMELNFDELDNVSGGYIPDDVWFGKMTKDERRAWQLRSLSKIQFADPADPCELTAEYGEYIPPKYR